MQHTLSSQQLKKRGHGPDRLSEKDALAVAALDHWQSERDAMKLVDNGSIIREDGLELPYEGETDSSPPQ